MAGLMAMATEPFGSAVVAGPASASGFVECARPAAVRWAMDLDVCDRFGIDQHAQPRPGDRFRPHLARTVDGANGEPVLAVAAGTKHEVLLRRRRFGVQLPACPAIGRDVQLHLDRLPGRIVGPIDAEGNGEHRLPGDDRFRQRRRGGRRRLSDKRHGDEQL